VNSEKEIKKNIVRNAFLPLLASGLCVPLFTGVSPAENALLGAWGLGVLVLTTGLIAVFSFRMPKNFRIGFALLVAVGVYSIALVTSAALRVSEQLPLASLAPLLIITGVLAGDNPAYTGKKSTSRAIVDGWLVGLCFIAGLVLLGEVRDVMVRIMTGPENPAGFRSIPLIFILIATSVFIIEVVAKLKRGAS